MNYGRTPYGAPRCRDRAVADDRSAAGTVPRGLAPIRVTLVLLALHALATPAEAQCPPRILVAYHSQTGHTRAMAVAVADGARAEGARVRLLPVDSVSTTELVAADAIIVGSPVHNANVAPSVQAFINRWPLDSGQMRNKVGAAFVSGGGISAGEETTQLAILRSMLVYGMIVVGGEDWTSAFGASAVTEEAPFIAPPGHVAARFLAKAQGLGHRVATIARRMTCPP
jgi:NAD(P)H dehydrogenase (quinone)